jgi:TonB family protein
LRNTQKIEKNKSLDWQKNSVAQPMIKHAPIVDSSIQEPNTDKKDSSATSRSRASIMKVVNKNIHIIRIAYNKRLRKNHELKGMVTVKFAVDEYGKVVASAIIKSTANDGELEASVNDAVKLWKFGKINKPGDVTVIVYPFVFN